MLQIRHFHKNGRPAWEVKVSAIVVGVFALLVLTLLTGENTAAWIATLFRR
jgi:hypothetical protein